MSRKETADLRSCRGGQRRGRVDGNHAGPRSSRWWRDGDSARRLPDAQHRAGANFIQTQKPMVYAIIFNNMVQAVLLLGVGIGFIYVACNVVKVRTRYVLPSILVIAVLGTYAVEGSISGPITLFVFAVLGFVLVRFDYPVAAVVVGILLGRMLETELLRSNQLAGGDPLYILNRPVALGIIAMRLISFIMTALGKKKQARIEAEEASLMRDLDRGMPDAGR
jgi:putative tricarboxylic transport membrane protein